MIATAPTRVNGHCSRVDFIGSGDHDLGAIAVRAPLRNRGATMMSKTQTTLAMLGLAVLSAAATAFAQGAQPPGLPKELAQLKSFQ
jgi:hypothetical protein